MLSKYILKKQYFLRGSTGAIYFGSNVNINRKGIIKLVHTQPDAPKKEIPKHWSEIPGFKSYPIIGSVIGMYRHKHFDLDRLHKLFEILVKEFGPIYKITSTKLLPSVVCITDPKDIEAFMKSTLNNPARFHFGSLKAVRQDAPANYFNQKGGLLPENGDEWWRVRSRTQGPLMKIQNIRKYLHAMDSVSLEFVEKVAKFQKERGEMPEYFKEELYKWALESVSLISLNRRLGCLANNLPKDSPQMQLINAAGNIMESMAVTEMYPYWRIIRTPSYKRLRNAHEVFRGLADVHIQNLEKRMNSKSQSDDSELTLMETLLKTPGLDRADVVTVILDMLMAGIDTTSHTMAFLIYLLAKNPERQKKLQEELDAVLGDGKEPMNEKHLAKVSYLKACVKETLRLFPIVFGIARILQEDLVLSGYLIPKGWQVISLNYVASRDESIISRASEFIPERWQRDQPYGAINPFVSLPFSHGTRSCIGRRIAEQELFTLGARLFHRFNVEYNYGEMDMLSRFIGIPDQPLKFSFTERR